MQRFAVVAIGRLQAASLRSCQEPHTPPHNLTGHASHGSHDTWAVGRNRVGRRREKGGSTLTERSDLISFGVVEHDWHKLAASFMVSLP